jgi:glycogen operon protein
MAFRMRHPVFRRRKWFVGRSISGGAGLADIAWFRPDGSEMLEEQWRDGLAKSLGVFLNGDAIPDPGPHGERITDDSFLLLFNAAQGPVVFTLPPEPWAAEWTAVLDTTDPFLDDGVVFHKAGAELRAEPISVVVLRRVS